MPSLIASGDVSIALLEKDYEVSSFGTVKRLKLLDDVFVQACQRARAAAPRKKEEKESRNPGTAGTSTRIKRTGVRPALLVCAPQALGE